MNAWCQRYDPSAAELRAQQAAGRRRLRFGKRLEPLFRRQLAADSRSKRMSLLIMLVVLHLVTPLYYGPLLHAPEAFVDTAYLWQYGLQLPAILVALLAVWRRAAPSANTVLCTLAFLAIVIGMLGQRTMGMTYGFHVPIEFAAIAIAGFMIGIRTVFWRALPWAIAAALAILANEWLFVPESPTAAYHVMCALILVAIALFWGYSIELAERDTWLKTRLLDHLARHDGLTGLLNRMAIDDALKTAFDDNRVRPRSVTLAMVDIDYFKAYNDNYGHARGDEVITRVARLCEAAVRPHCGACARYGGEEMILLWLGASFDYACSRARRLQEQLALCDIAHLGSPIADRLTLSIGLFHIPADQLEHFAAVDDSDAKSPGARLIETADRLLYKAKNEGRNRMMADQQSRRQARGRQAAGVPAKRADRPAARIA